MDIHRAESKDYSSIAKLHRDGIKKGFLSSLGIPFLSRLYKAINCEPGACVLVAEDKNDIVGFIAGVADIRGLYKKILMKQWFHFMVPLLRYMCDTAVLKKMVETVLYGLKTDKQHESACKAELLSVALDENVRGKGVGGKLIHELEVFFKECGVSRYQVVTFSKDIKSNSFYGAYTFELIGSFVHHGNTMNEYIKEIK